MGTEPLARKLAAILYADVAGYSRLTGEDEDGTQPVLGAPMPTVDTPMPTVDASMPPLTHTIAFELTLVSGPDGAGLAGAMLTFTVTFANPTVYDPGPVALAASHTFTISGSTGSDGVYTDPDGMVYDPAFTAFVDTGTFFPVFGQWRPGGER